MDGIFMSFTLELFDTPDIPRVLAECNRVLKPGGRLVVVGMSKEGPQGLLIRAFEWTHQHFPNLFGLPAHLRPPRDRSRRLLVRRLLVVHSNEAKLKTEHLPSRMLRDRSSMSGDHSLSALPPRYAASESRNQAEHDQLDFARLIEHAQSRRNVSRTASAFGLSRQRAYRLVQARPDVAL